VSWHSPQPKRKPKRLPKWKPIKTISSGIGDKGITGGSISLHTWYLVGYYYDGSTVSLWVDGSEVDSASVSAIGNNDEPLCIGIREVRAKPTGWDGRIDQVRFYNRKCVQVLTT